MIIYIILIYYLQCVVFGFYNIIYFDQNNFKHLSPVPTRPAYGSPKYAQLSVFVSVVARSVDNLIGRTRRTADAV